MKRNPITLTTAAVLVLIAGFMLFTFQVRQTEVAVVTTFGRYSRSITDAGWQLRLPWPIQKIYEFDNRIQTFEGKYDQIFTGDQVPLLVSVYVGWRIADPRVFLESFNDDLPRAEQTLEQIVRNAKSGVVSQHAFSDLISTNRADLKFDQIEKEMIEGIRTRAASYGVQVEILGVKRLGLPQSTTAKVFERMRTERQQLISAYHSEGERRAKEITANADVEANEILARARAEAIRTTGEAERKAAEYYSEFEKNPKLAIFLFQLKAMEESLKERTYLILGPQTPPFNLLNSATNPGISPATGRK
jgi:membrane protease subunit HflC